MADVLRIKRDIYICLMDFGLMQISRITENGMSTHSQSLGKLARELIWTIARIFPHFTKSQVNSTQWLSWIFICLFTMLLKIENSLLKTTQEC